MDVLKHAVIFLLREYTEIAGAKYTRYITQIADLKETDPLRQVLGEERDRLEFKLGKAKAFIQVLEKEEA